MEMSRERFLELAHKATERAGQIVDLLEEVPMDSNHVELLALSIVTVTTMLMSHHAVKHIPNVENSPVKIHNIAHAALDFISECITDQIAASAAGN